MRLLIYLSVLVITMGNAVPAVSQGNSICLSYPSHVESLARRDLATHDYDRAETLLTLGVVERTYCIRHSTGEAKTRNALWGASDIYAEAIGYGFEGNTSMANRLKAQVAQITGGILTSGASASDKAYARKLFYEANDIP